MDSDKLNKFLDLATQWLEKQLEEKTVESYVVSQVKQTAFDMGVKEIFDKLGKGDRPELDELINKEKGRVTEMAIKAIKQNFGGKK